MKKTYVVIAEGWLDGVWRAKGEEMSLTTEEARHLEIAGSIAEKPIHKARSEAEAKATAKD